MDRLRQWTLSTQSCRMVIRSNISRSISFLNILILVECLSIGFHHHKWIVLVRLSRLNQCNRLRIEQAGRYPDKRVIFNAAFMLEKVGKQCIDSGSFFYKQEKRSIMLRLQLKRFNSYSHPPPPALAVLWWNPSIYLPPSPLFFIIHLAFEWVKRQCRSFAFFASPSRELKTEPNWVYYHWTHFPNERSAVGDACACEPARL